MKLSPRRRNSRLSQGLSHEGAVAAAAFSNLYSAKFVRASSQYATMTAANFGSYDTAKFAIFGYIEQTTNNFQGVYGQGNGTAANSAFIFDQQSNQFRLRTFEGAVQKTTTTTATYSAGVRRAYMWHYDSANATASLRKRLWIDGVEVTAFDLDETVAAAVNTSSELVYIGSALGSSTIDGKLDETGLVSGSLPAWGDIFDGSNVILDISALPGLFSWPRFENSWLDSKSGKTWTPNNSPTFELN